MGCVYYITFQLFKKTLYLCFLIEMGQPFKVIHAEDSYRRIWWGKVLRSEKLCIVVVQSQTQS